MCRLFFMQGDEIVEVSNSLQENLGPQGLPQPEKKCDSISLKNNSK